MITRWLIVFCGITLCLGSLSCQKISDRASKQLLKVKPIESVDAIPAEYGNLVGVTQKNVNWALLWFEKPDKTIVIVGVQIQGNSIGLGETVAVIPRSSR